MSDTRRVPDYGRDQLFMPVVKSDDLPLVLEHGGREALMRCRDLETDVGTYFHVLITASSIGRLLPGTCHEETVWLGRWFDAASESLSELDDLLAECGCDPVGGQSPQVAACVQLMHDMAESRAHKGTADPGD